MKKDVSIFFLSCIHFLATQGGHQTSGPWGEELDADRQNELLQFHLLFMGTAVTGDQYFLFMKCDMSGYVWLLPTPVVDTGNSGRKDRLALKFWRCSNVGAGSRLSFQERGNRGVEEIASSKPPFFVCV